MDSIHPMDSASILIERRSDLSAVLSETTFSKMMPTVSASGWHSLSSKVWNVSQCIRMYQISGLWIPELVV